MKAKSFGLLLLVIALGLSLSGCGCFKQAMKGEAAPPPVPEPAKIVPPPHKEEVVVEKRAPAPAPTPRSAPAPAPAPAPKPAPAAVLQPIYFDLNKSAIRPDAAETLKKNLQWFRQNPGNKVRVQGNCDPRATKKYNHILGQRRAGATKKYLAGLGVKAAFLETISYGKDRSTCKVKEESCWERERRVDFEPTS